MIVKAEILWTRKCPLSCHYCNMATGLSNSRSLDFWKRGLHNLKKLNCSFIAIYGAEPLADFSKLPGFIAYARRLDIDLTLITSGCVPGAKEKLEQLYKVGLRSLTTSYDIIDLDLSSAAKSNKAIHLLNHFKKLGPVDNLAVVVTLTRKNYKHVYETAVEMTRQGIWLFFDIIHPDRGQLGSKAKGRDESLLFQKQDIPELVIELNRLKNAKSYLKIHASKQFFDLLIHNPDFLLDYNWNCAEHSCFPSWVTIDCDGLVYPCDDFQPKGLPISLDHLYENWQSFHMYWKNTIQTSCPGCVWNTHIDAHYIKQGLVNISEYVHK